MFVFFHRQQRDRDLWSSKVWHYLSVFFVFLYFLFTKKITKSDERGADKKINKSGETTNRWVHPEPS